MKKYFILPLSFLFTNILFAQNSTRIDSSAMQDGFFESFTFIVILINVVIIALISIAILGYKLAKQGKKKIYLGDEKFIQLKKAFEKLKDEHLALKEENDKANHDIKILKNSIVELEETNIKLLEQKQHLSENESQLMDLQKQKEELFAIAIHDIKNPLSAIKGYAQLLEEYDLNATEQQEIVQNLISSTDKILDLAFEMNRVVIESERATQRKKAGKVSVYDTIKSVCSQNMAYAKKKKVRIVNQASQNTPDVDVDPEKLEEVLFNLINNAIKFSPEETIVQIKSFFSKNEVTIEVVDNGVGIAKEDLPNAFTKGGTLTAKPTGGEKSTGLGLWIVKKIVEDNGGGVWVDSKLNIGSTFGFSLPLAKEED